MFLRLRILALAVLTCVSIYSDASVNVTVNGSTYVIPQTNEKGWGTNVTNWIQAISGATLQPNGGTFTLTSDSYFGANFGLVSQYYKSPTTNISSAGILRLAKSDSIGFRNNANSANLLLGINASDQLTFTGGIVATSSAGTFSDLGFAVYNNADNTKILAIDASAIATGMTRTLKMANAAVDLANLSAATITTGTLPAARLPTPTASTLGGIQSITGVANQWIASISTAGIASLSQPAFSNISGTASLTTQVTGTLPIANGGTNNGSLGVDAGGVYYSDGTKLVNLAHGTSGNVLTSGGTSAPTWTAPLVNPMTTGGDIIYGGASGAVARLANGSALQFLQSSGGTSAPIWASLPADSTELVNCSIASSVGSSALTITLNDASGSSPTSTSTCKIAFRNSTAATGTYSEVSATAATSLVISNGSALGCTASVACTVYVYAINNAGTIELGAIGRTTVDEGTVQTSTAEGGAGAADLSSVLYSTTARTSKAVRLLARITITPAAAFAWTANSTEISNSPFQAAITPYIYTNTSGQTIANNTNTVVTNWGLSSGSPSIPEFNATTGVLTSVNGGVYLVNSHIVFATTGSPTGGLYFHSILLKNGGVYSNGSYNTASGQGASDHFDSVIAMPVFLLPSETISIAAFQNSSVSKTLSATAGDNMISIIRLGL